MSVRENLTLAALPTLSQSGIVSRERQQELVERFIKRLGIKTAGPDQPIRELSGGNQQKVLLARWLCLNPRLLILDEATEGLAPLIRAEIWQCLTRLKAAGQSILVIDKNVEALIRIADRHYMIERGRVVWVGTSRELAAAPAIQHRYLGV
jgi:branched-chain amino acid transport system ATP-binding protein